MAKQYLQSGPLLKKFAGFWIKPWVMAVPNIMIHRHGKIPELLLLMDSLSSGTRLGEGGFFWVSGSKQSLRRKGCGGLCRALAGAVQLVPFWVLPSEEMRSGP